MTGARRRRVVAALATTLFALLTVLGSGAGPAHATGYRYWSFWKWSDGTWAYQQQGPALYVPQDGGVDGWRFAVSPDGGQDAARPGAPGDFATVCAATPARPGGKRVAVVIDFGTPADAPSGEHPPERRTACAAVAAGATSAEVLAAVAPPLRYDTGGMLCAIAGYPRAGCGEALTGPQPSGGGSSGSGPELGLIAGGAIVAVLAAGAVWQLRRRR
ncbi:SCO2322 family protein [Kitasatospora sp. NPDC050543]|uniref:SCO2322 family protein n=1 Tax=Kitasatospora sp. NPDC050543 TaxID=3364054 RepID=UPI0037AB008E